ncbi:MAG: hypothetical protein J6I46_01645 [Ruminococcus sp.]|nr:hypothetical protein [Ruminococcus sp.]
MIIQGMDYWVRYVSLPLKVHGMTVQDEDGFYNVYINSDQSEEVQRAAYDHELEHIKRHDFDRTDLPLEAVENM